MGFVASTAFTNERMAAPPAAARLGVGAEVP
jgi:hypothetical protein